MKKKIALSNIFNIIRYFVDAESLMATFDPGNTLLSCNLLKLFSNEKLF